MKLEFGGVALAVIVHQRDDKTGEIIGKSQSDAAELHTVAQIKTFIDQAKQEIETFNATQNRPARRARAKSPSASSRKLKKKKSPSTRGN